jgi:hypothetical protein
MAYIFPRMEWVPTFRTNRQLPARSFLREWNPCKCKEWRAFCRRMNENTSYSLIKFSFENDWDIFFQNTLRFPQRH